MDEWQNENVVLEVRPPVGEPFRVPLEGERLVLGRAYDCDVVIPDPRVSQRHAEIVRSDLGYVIRDLGSTNGTFLEDRRVKEALLLIGAVARIGPTRVQLVSVEPENTMGLKTDSISVTSLLEGLDRRHERPQPPKQALRLSTLVQLSGELNAVGEEGALLEAVAQAVFRLIATDQVYVLTLRNGHLVPRVAKHAGGAAAHLALRLSSGMLYAAVRDKRVIYTSNVSEDPSLGARPSAARFSIRSAVTLPLIVGERVLGVLHTDRSRTTAYSTADLELLALLGHQTAATLARVRLISNLYTRNADLERAKADLLLTSGELQRLNRELEARVQERTREKDRLMAMVAHDVRSPLTAVQLFIDMIAMQPSVVEGDPELREQLEATHDLIQQANNLLGDLVDASAVALGSLRVEREPTTLPPVLEAVVVPWRRVASTKGFRVALDVADDLPRVRCDGRRVGQIVQNLVHNAVKFSSRGDVVTVEARQGPDGVEVAVADQGPGVAPEDREKILGTFVQGSVRRAGQGLGLAIAQQLSLAHGRGLRVEDAAGGGARFVLTLPLADLPTTPEDSEAYAEPAPRSEDEAPGAAAARGPTDPNDTMVA